MICSKNQYCPAAKLRPGSIVLHHLENTRPSGQLPVFLFREETCSRFGKGLDQPAILFPAIQKPGVQLAVALDLDGAALFDHEQIAQRLSNHIRHVDAPGQAGAFHPAGRIYGVSDGVSPFSLESME